MALMLSKNLEMVFNVFSDRIFTNLLLSFWQFQ